MCGEGEDVRLGGPAVVEPELKSGRRATAYFYPQILARNPKKGGPNETICKYCWFGVNVHCCPFDNAGFTPPHQAVIAADFHDHCCHATALHSRADLDVLVRHADQVCFDQLLS